jgi:esterase/lipase superfamily enzyme
MQVAMRNAGLIVALLVGATLAHAQTASDVAKAPAATPARPSQLFSIARKSYALIVGIDDYSKGWRRLNEAVADAEAVYEVLKAQGFDARLERNLTAAKLREAIDEFFITAGSDPEARLLFWFAGHGHTTDQIYTGKQTGYIVAADAANPMTVPDAQRQIADIELRRRSIAIEDITAQMRRSNARHILLVFDSCFSGSAFTGTRSGYVPPSVEAYASNPVRQLITSGTKGQEVDDNGKFRDLFLRAIKGEIQSADANRDGYITGTELGSFLTDRVMNATGAKQTPVFGALREDYDTGDFVFVLPWKAEQLARSGAARPAESPGEPSEEAQRFWSFVREQRDAKLIQRYLETFPDTPYRSVALDELKQHQGSVKSAKEFAESSKSGTPLTTTTTPASKGPPAATDAWSAVSIVFATTRQVEPPRAGAVDPGIAFGPKRAGLLSFGKADVTIPKTHVVGAIERPTTFELALSGFSAQAQDPKKHVTVRNVSSLTRQELANTARERQTAARSKDALVYVHGYNSRFEDALFRAGQIAYDTAYDGTVYVFSWPSAGSVSAYLADREAALLSEPFFREFLELIGREIGDGAINVVAHAQGGDIVLGALQTAATTAAARLRLGQIVLAAPDLGIEAFNAACAKVKPLARGITVYASASDRALAAARTLAGSDRAGQIGADGGPTVALDCATVIDVTTASTESFQLNHSAFAERSTLLGDLQAVLKAPSASTPDQRSAAMRRTVTPKGTYWRLAN